MIYDERLFFVRYKKVKKKKMETLYPGTKYRIFHHILLLYTNNFCVNFIFIHQNLRMIQKMLQ
jgi:hypothetical protein